MMPVARRQQVRWFEPFLRLFTSGLALMDWTPGTHAVLSVPAIMFCRLRKTVELAILYSTVLEVNAMVSMILYKFIDQDCERC